MHSGVLSFHWLKSLVCWIHAFIIPKILQHWSAVAGHIITARDGITQGF